MVKVQVSDVNDNRPTFYPRQYKVSLPERDVSSGALVAVAATDADSAANGRIRYSIVSGNTAGLFRIDASTGEVGGGRGREGREMVTLATGLTVVWDVKRRLATHAAGSVPCAGAGPGSARASRVS